MKEKESRNLHLFPIFIPVVEQFKPQLTSVKRYNEKRVQRYFSTFSFSISQERKRERNRERKRKSHFRLKRSDLSEEAEKENKEERSFGGWIEFPSLSLPPSFSFLSLSLSLFHFSFFRSFSFFNCSLSLSLFIFHSLPRSKNGKKNEIQSRIVSGHSFNQTS